MKIISTEQFKHTPLINHKTGEAYSLSYLVSDFFGSKQVFLTHDKIAPHQRSSAPHRHSFIEEIVFIYKGQVTLQFGQQTHELQQGSFVFFEPQDSELHCLINQTDADVETITFSLKRNNDTVIYKAGAADSQSNISRDNIVRDDISQVWQPPILETDRLLLRPITLADAAGIFSYAKNPNVCQYTLWEAHQSVEDSMSYIQDYVFDYYAKGTPEPLGITLKNNPQKVIGTVGCFWTSKPARSMELAYAIGEEHWGQGLVAEAARAMMNYCFKEFSLKRIQARCKTDNKASAKVMEKIGMTYEGTLRSAIFHREKFWDMHYYAKVLQD